MNLFFHLVIIISCFLTFQTVNANLNGEGTICGRTLEGNYHFQRKIVGGYDVGYYKYPWYATLEKSDFVYCAGSLIANKTILTAAHCYHEYINKTKIKLEDIYHVKLGVYNHCEKEKTQKLFTIDKVIIHQDYKFKWPYYDIAILILKENTTDYSPICLPSGPIKGRPREAIAPGLGTLKYEGKTPCKLQEARLLIYSDDECRKMLKNAENDASQLYKALCAGYLAGGIDTCQGDSGGPLQILDEYSNYYLLGVVSFGFECARPNRLGIYTDASGYIDWIEEKAGFQTTISNTTTETPSSIVISTTTTKPTSISKPSAKPPPSAATTQQAPYGGNHPHHQFVWWPAYVVRPQPLQVFIFNHKKNKEILRKRQHGIKNKSKHPS